MCRKIYNNQLLQDYHNKKILFVHLPSGIVVLDVFLLNLVKSSLSDKYVASAESHRQDGSHHESSDCHVEGDTRRPRKQHKIQEV